jgi:hypothetical protein
MDIYVKSSALSLDPSDELKYGFATEKGSG